MHGTGLVRNSLQHASAWQRVWMGVFAHQRGVNLARLLFKTSLNLPPPLYLFPGTTRTKYHKVGASNTNVYCLVVLEARNPKTRCGQDNILFLKIEEYLIYSIVLIYAV